MAIASRPQRQSKGGLRAQRARRAASFRVLIAFALLTLTGSSPAFGLTNGDFSDGLTGWVTTGVAEVLDGELRLTDDRSSQSSAWQVAPTEAPRSVLEFDVLGSLSATIPSDPFGFPDFFSTSIYLFDEPAGFTPSSGTAASAVSVLSLDWQGPYASATELSPAERGGDWLHVRIEFNTPNAYFAPVFEIFEFGFNAGDSQVWIDDVVLAPIPEPGTAFLMLLGLIGLNVTRTTSLRQGARR